MRCKISKNKTNPYTISIIAIFFAASISGFLDYYYCFFAYPAVYAQQQPKSNVDDISKSPTAAVNTTSQEQEPQIAVPSISIKDLNNTIDTQSSGVDDKGVEELSEAEPEDNTETGSENIDNEKIDKQETKNLEEKGGDSKQIDKNQQQGKSSDESTEFANTGSIAEEEKDIRQKPEKGEKQEQADNKEEQQDEKKLDKTRGRDSTDSDKGGEQKMEDRDEIEEGEEEEIEEGEEEEIEEGEEEEIEEGEEEEPKDKSSDDTPLELPFP